jgi:hypothetical protein
MDPGEAEDHEQQHGENEDGNGPLGTVLEAGRDYLSTEANDAEDGVIGLERDEADDSDNQWDDVHWPELICDLRSRVGVERNRQGESIEGWLRRASESRCSRGCSTISTSPTAS